MVELVPMDVACRVAGLNPQRVNEAAADGAYPAAPPAVRGTPRLFSPDDLLMLLIFGARLRLGEARGRAADFADVVMEGVRIYPEAASIFVVENLLGSRWAESP